MSDGPNGKRRGLMILGAAAVAGMIAGAVGVYVSASGDGNVVGPAAQVVDCAGALAAGKRVSPLTTGEMAAFRVADGADPLLDLTFKAPDGSDASLADFAGKTVLLNLWATWCVPCRAEMPALDRLQKALGGENFSVLAVNVDVKNPERAKAFLDEIGVTGLDFYADPSMAIFNAMKKRGLAFGLPTTVLVDGKGCRIGGVEGPAEWDSEEARALIRTAVAAD
jgi:thiol-disulfide isomerase/thioredoxin